MSEILNLIQTRQSTRAPFDCSHSIAQADLRQILEAGRWAPTAHNMQNFEVVVVDDPKLLEAIGNIPRPISAAFIRENARQLSATEEELLHKKVGLLAAMFPPAWRNPDANPEVLTEPGEAPRAYAPSPVLLFVLYDPSRRAPASEGDFLGIISLGCMLENMWLVAQTLGIGFQIESAFRAGPVEAEARRLLNIPASLQIAFAVRLGYAAAAPVKSLRVRREIEDFTHHNRFGEKGLE
jgi:nitroreductase